MLYAVSAIRRELPSKALKAVKAVKALRAHELGGQSRCLSQSSPYSGGRDDVGAELVKVGSAPASEPAVQHFAGRIFGPPTDEVGEYIAERIRYRRWKQQLKILRKAEAKLRAAGVEPQRVRLNVLTPLLGYASLEEDDDLADQWAHFGKCGRR